MIAMVSPSLMPAAASAPAALAARALICAGDNSLFANDKVGNMLRSMPQANKGGTVHLIEVGRRNDCCFQRARRVRDRFGVMYGRRPRCKRNLTISEAFGCGHVFGL